MSASLLGLPPELLSKILFFVMKPEKRTGFFDDVGGERVVPTGRKVDAIFLVNKKIYQEALASSQGQTTIRMGYLGYVEDVFADRKLQIQTGRPPKLRNENLIQIEHTRLSDIACGCTGCLIWSNAPLLAGKLSHYEQISPWASSYDWSIICTSLKTERKHAATANDCGMRIQAMSPPMQQNTDPNRGEVVGFLLKPHPILDMATFIFTNLDTASAPLANAEGVRFSHGEFASKVREMVGLSELPHPI